LIESIVRGDGGDNHTETLRPLVEAGADVHIADGSGSTPLQWPSTGPIVGIISVTAKNSVLPQKNCRNAMPSVCRKTPRAS
jgi:hypothetical protein